MKVSEANVDKAGKQYWDHTERNRHVQLQPFTPAAGVRAFGRRMWDQMFQMVLGQFSGHGKSLLELGCGGSAFLPYFSDRFGFQVHGIDYSEEGCELANTMCRVNGVTAQVVCANFLQPPTEMKNAFDVVVSFGVLEHFTDTAYTLSKFAEFLRPGGLLLTVVPNMKGLVGTGQALLASDIFDLHELITLTRLRVAHEAAGLVMLENRYFMFANFGVINIGPAASLVRRSSLVALRAVTGLIWAVESVLGPLPPNSISSPYLLCVARFPGTAGDA